MGWDQSTGRQDVQSLLLDLLGVDPNELLRQVIEQKLAEQGLSYEVEEDTDREEGDGMVEIFHPRQIKFSDGRVFVETLTETVRSDDWGSDFYGFVEAGKPYKILRVDYNGPGDEPEVSEELVPGDDGNVTSIDDIRERGNALSDGLGDEISDFFISQGIDSVSFEPAEECGDMCGSCGYTSGPSKICDCSCHE